MTAINPISFRGGGTESAGSIAYRNITPETPVEENKVNFRGGGTETAGSMANKPISQPETDTVQFRGGGTETAGSVAHADEPSECPNCGKPVSFKGRNNNDDNKTAKVVGVIGGLVALTAATIIALGYAHKTGSFTKLGDGWFGKAVKKLEPAGQKCHDWCAITKKTGLEYWEKCKGFFSSKKD